MQRLPRDMASPAPRVVRWSIFQYWTFLGWKAGVNPPPATFGIATNLLGQRQTLQFDEVREGEAIYYLALLSHADEEFYRLVLQVPFPNGESVELRFEQLMYWER